MKAFMSPVQEVGSSMAPSARSLGVAEQEARRILAEVEPDTRGLAGCLQTRAYSVKERGRLGSAFDNAQAALIETLTKFVSE